MTYQNICQYFVNGGRVVTDALSHGQIKKMKTKKNSNLTQEKVRVGVLSKRHAY